MDVRESRPSGNPILRSGSVRSLQADWESRIAWRREQLIHDNIRASERINEILNRSDLRTYAEEMHEWVPKRLTYWNRYRNIPYRHISILKKGPTDAWDKKARFPFPLMHGDAVSDITVETGERNIYTNTSDYTGNIVSELATRGEQDTKWSLSVYRWIYVGKDYMRHVPDGISLFHEGFEISVSGNGLDIAVNKYSEPTSFAHVPFEEAIDPNTSHLAIWSTYCNLMEQPVSGLIPSD